MSKNLITRIIVAAVAIPIILWICYRGGGWLFGMVALFALVAMAEYLINEGYSVGSFFFWLGMVLAALMVLSRFDAVSGWFWLQFLFSGPAGVLLVLLVAGMIFATGTQPPGELFRRYTRYTWGLLYVGLLYPFVYLLGESRTLTLEFGTDGGDWLLFLFGVLWVGDTAAMGIGRWLGRHKLAPAVSPNKTVEGFIGGIVGALVIGVIMYFWKFNQVAWYHVLILSIGCSVFGQLGDLVESMWKRSLSIKDSSAIIPGHGGALDRFDSLLFAAPFMFFYRLLLLIK